ncbi:hypothetical protein F5Y01DRAFT_288725 [Xylaria sp. FL0043]|nr:hypothetical protein F5Y01DRAFT_288725 [Xylaria sp. FL0043]
MAQSSTRSEALTAPSTQAGTGCGKTRSACDRCHRQKLRCIKAVQRTACERCERLTIECRYSPRERRTVRSKKRSRTTPPPSDSRNLAPAIIAPPAAPGMRRQGVTAAVPASLDCGDWLAFQTAAGHNAEGLGYLNPGLTSPIPIPMAQAGHVAARDTHPLAQLNAPPSLYSVDCGDGVASRILADHHHNVAGQVGDDYLPDLCHFQGNDNHPNGPSCGPGYTLTSTAQQLTSLNMALYECASKLPSIKASRAGGPDVSRTTNSATTRGAALLVLDEVFHVTTTFINIMNAVDPMFTHTHDEITPALEIPSPSSLHLDEASVLLFLSCHCRLTDIYEAIFQAIQRCIRGSSHTAAPHSTAAGIILPQLQVGGFGGVSSPALRVDFKGPRLPSAIVSMYMVLITTLSSRLWAQIKDRMRRTGGRDCSRSGAAMVHPDIAEPTWDRAMERTDNLSRIIEGIRDVL